MPVKVCHFTSTHTPKDQRIFYKECVSLARAGYAVSLVEQGNSEETEGVQIIGTGEQKKGRFYRLLVRPKKIYKIAKKVDADIYHFHDMELIPYGLKLKRNGKTVIFDYHEDYAMRFSESDALPFPKWIKKLLSKLYCAYEKYAVSKFDAIISVTPHVCERLKKVNPKTYMITNYPLLDGGQWKPDGSYNADSNYIAFAGQISETYCLTYITKEIQDIPDIKFRICGPERKPGDFQKIKSADVGDRIEYLGKLPYMELPQFLKNARCAMVMGQYSANSAGNLGTLGINKLFEAMLCGIPVVCTDFILWKEIIDHYKCGIYVHNNDEGALKTAVSYIINHPQVAEEMGKAGRRAVLEKYNWKSQEKVLYDLYREMSEVLNKKNS